ncbi:MAG: PHP domain-containing protein [Bauldia sp.]|nr:MAG: PHP domain-containing protein [Bauldia sp.]
MRIKVDLHNHTNFSFDGEMNPRRFVEVYTRLGFGAVAVTDHNTRLGALAVAELDPPFRVIVSCEVKSREGEIIGLFLDRDIPRGLSAIDTAKATTMTTPSRSPNRRPCPSEALTMIVKCYRQLDREDDLREYLERLAALALEAQAGHDLHGGLLFVGSGFAERGAAISGHLAVLRPLPHRVQAAVRRAPPRSICRRPRLHIRRGGGPSPDRPPRCGPSA